MAQDNVIALAGEGAAVEYRGQMRMARSLVLDLPSMVVEARRLRDEVRKEEEAMRQVTVEDDGL